MMVSYRLPIMTIVLSLTIWLQFVIECLRRSNQQRGWSVWVEIWWFPSEQIRDVVVGRKRSSNVCDLDTSTSRTDRQTDRRLP